jgi:hypothetical protein
MPTLKATKAWYDKDVSFKDILEGLGHTPGGPAHDL